MIISVINSKECFGYEPIKNMKPSTEYDETKHLAFYHEPLQAGAVILKAGDFVIVSPEEGHAPKRMTENGPCHVKKIVVKVKL